MEIPLELNVGGQLLSACQSTLCIESDSKLYNWFVDVGDCTLPKDDSGRWFIDRDPVSFSSILNFLRLRKSGQLWEACLPKDPDRLAMLTQEAEYFNLPLLREKAVHLLQAFTHKHDTDYFAQVMVNSKSFPMGFDTDNTTK